MYFFYLDEEGIRVAHVFL